MTGWLLRGNLTRRNCYKGIGWVKGQMGWQGDPGTSTSRQLLPSPGLKGQREKMAASEGTSQWDQNPVGDVARDTGQSRGEWEVPPLHLPRPPPTGACPRLNLLKPVRGKVWVCRAQAERSRKRAESGTQTLRDTQTIRVYWLLLFPLNMAYTFLFFIYPSFFLKTGHFIIHCIVIL